MRTFPPTPVCLEEGLQEGRHLLGTGWDQELTWPSVRRAGVSAEETAWKGLGDEELAPCG